MSITFSTPVTLRQWPSDKKPQDIYFQPGLTWTQQGTQGVALLFLENDTDSADITKQDFRELVKGLMRWVWAAAGNDEVTTITQAEVQSVYDEFATTSLSYMDLKTFLSAHYRFNIQECVKDMEGTVFPMFPSLQLQIGNSAPVSFSPANKQLDTTDINNLRAYYAQLQVQFDAGTRANTIVASSVTEFLFVGYARLLMRNGLQTLIDYLEAGEVANNIVTLLDTSLPNGSYSNIAQMASRFLLNGFNLPEDFFGPNDPTADEGLYVSTGQQYTLSNSLASSNSSSEYRVTLQMGAVQEDFISFPENAQQIVYSIPGTPAENDPKYPFWALSQALNSLSDATVATLHSAQPTLIPYYRTENLHFALRNRVEWPPSYLLPLPTDLLNHLEQHTPNPSVDLRVWTNGDPAQASDVHNDNFTWATRIDLTLLRIPNPDRDGFLKETYEVGSSSEKDKDLLEAIWNFLNTTSETDPVNLTFLYVSESGATSPTVRLVPGVQDDILLIKTNLSTETTEAPSTDFSAQLSDKNNFLRLLWKALDVDTGGFFLHIPHGSDSLDATVFGSSNSAVLPFLIEFTNPSDPIHDFNNYAVFTQAIDVENDMVLARSTESIPVLTIPPGFLGFQIDDRPESPAEQESGAPNDGPGELNVLYQLLGWRVAAHTQFKASNPGLPIGPTELPGSNGNSSDKWLYERMVPVFSLLSTTPNPGTTGLPPHEKDPYLGVGNASGDDQSALKVDIKSG